ERFEMLAFHLYTTGLLPPRIEYLECLREYVNSLDLSLEQHSQIRAVIEKSKKINIPEAKRDLAFTTAFQLFVYFEHQYANKKLVTYPGFVTSTLQSNIEIISSIKTTNMNLYKNAQSQILTTLRNQLTDKGGRPINPALLAGMQVSIKLLKPAMTSKYADSKLDAIFNHLNNAYKKSMVFDQANDLGKKKIVIEP
ncbi:MAG: hypothetical protein NTV34_12800, partial [Proteobacteria bacterium]|nr:hypothetical protein [Pseudomonadota bacterium]